MKNVLLGNGVNIQFSGNVYTSKYIVARMKYNARIGKYDDIFGGVVSGAEIVELLGNLAETANGIVNGEYDDVEMDANTKLAFDDFKSRYSEYTIEEIHDVMLEDWFFLVHMFFIVNDDLAEQSQCAIQEFEQMLLDCIYNDGRIQNLHEKMGKKVKRYFKEFDNIFTLNYDCNMEKLTGKTIYHLHGDFNVLSASEDEHYVRGYIKKNRGLTVVIQGKEYLYCNALLNFSGEGKAKIVDANYQLNKLSADYARQYEEDEKFRTELEALKISGPEAYEMIMTKIEHPELHMGMEYYFDKLKEIEDELYIIGMSPNNDGHIYRCIESNPKLKKVYIYCFSQGDYDYIKNNMRDDLYEPLWINELWKSLDCEQKKFNCNYGIKSKLAAFKDVFTSFADFQASDDEIEACVNSIPVYEQKRLCGLVKDELDRKNPGHNSTDREEFEKTRASISHIAVQEGVLPPALFVITIMHFND